MREEKIKIKNMFLDVQYYKKLFYMGLDGKPYEQRGMLLIGSHPGVFHDNCH
jgi:hypothetical protein